MPIYVCEYVCLCLFVVDLPATTVSERCRRTSTCSIRPTSVQACRLRTLFRRIAMNTLQISACKKEIERERACERDDIIKQLKDKTLQCITSAQFLQSVCVSLCVCMCVYPSMIQKSNKKRTKNGIPCNMAEALIPNYSTQLSGNPLK